MNEPKLNRCLHCGSSDVEIDIEWVRPGNRFSPICMGCYAHGPEADYPTIEAAAQAWNESCVAKASETLARHLYAGCDLRPFPFGDPPRCELWSRPGVIATMLASGETMLDMVMDLQDRVGK